MDPIIQKYLSIFIKEQFPRHYEEYGPIFIRFVEAYYEWLETQGPLKDSRNLDQYMDIDTTIDDFIIYFKNKYLQNIQLPTTSNIKFLVKNSLDVYRSRGTIRSIDLMFRLIFGTGATVYYPWNDVFRLSSGEWIVPQYIEVSSNENLRRFVGKEIEGYSSGATAFVESWVQKKRTSKLVDVLYISSLVGDFQTNEYINLRNEPLPIGECPAIIGSLSGIIIDSSEADQKIGQELLIEGTNGWDAIATVADVSRVAGKAKHDFKSGGYGYTNNAILLISNSVLTLQKMTVGNNSSDGFFSPFETIKQETANLVFQTSEIIVANSLFDHTAITPANVEVDSGVTLGFVFAVTRPSTIDKVYFWKTASDITTSRTVALYESSGWPVLSSITTSSEPTGNGQWIEVNLPSPIALDAYPKAYIVGVGYPNGNYSANSSQFNTELRNPANTIIGVNSNDTNINGSPIGNGRFSYSNNGIGEIFPNQTFGDTNYWIDVSITPSSSGTGGIFYENDSVFSYNANDEIIGQAIVLNNQQIGSNGEMQVSVLEGTFANGETIYVSGNTFSANVISYSPTVVTANIIGESLTFSAEISEIQGEFIIGETIYQDNAEATLKYIAASGSLGTIYAENKIGVWNPNKTFSGQTSHANAKFNNLVLNIGIIGASGSFINDDRAPLVGQTTGTFGLLQRISTGSGSTVTILDPLYYTENIEINTDYIYDYANTFLAANGYGFPTLPTANLSTVIHDALTYNVFEIGRISGILSTTGDNYSTPPFVRILEPLIYGSKIASRNLLKLSNTSAGFVAGEVVDQNGAKGLVLSSNSSQMIVERISYNNEFVVTSNSLFHLIGEDSGTSANVDHVSDYFDYAADLGGKFMGLNAVIDSSISVSNGVVTSAKIKVSGWGFENNENIIIRDRAGNLVATGRTVLGKQGIGPGFYRTRTGFLSSTSRLQDSDYYQVASYEVRASVTFDRYADMLRQLLHVAGTKPFGAFYYNSQSLVSTNILPAFITPPPISILPPDEPDPSSPHDPLLSEWPNPLNTGVPFGTVLTPYAGNFVTTSDGQIIENLDISGSVTIAHNNCIVRKCRVASASDYQVIGIADGVSGTIIEDCKIDGTVSSFEGMHGIAGVGIFRRNDISRVENCITVSGSGDVTTIIQDNYMHDMLATGLPHYDGIQMDGPAQNVIIRHNRIINDHDQTSAIMIDNWAGAIDNIMVSNNWISGGTYTIYVDNQFEGGTIQNVVVRNNLIDVGLYGFFRISEPSTIVYGNYSSLNAFYPGQTYETFFSDLELFRPRPLTSYVEETNQNTSFRLVVTPLPKPAKDNWPNSLNCGDLVGRKLTVSTGTLSTSSAGQIIENMKITGTLDIKHDDVIVRNCHFISSNNAIRANYGAANVIIVNCLIEAGNTGIIGGDFTLRDSYILNCVDCINLTSNNVVIDHNYLLLDGPDDGSIYDGIQTNGNSSNVQIINNVIENKIGQTSCIMIDNSLGGMSNILVANNKLSGGLYTLYLHDDAGHDQITNVTIRDNIFGEIAPQIDYINFRSDFGNNPTMFGNIDADTGDYLVGHEVIPAQTLFDANNQIHIVVRGGTSKPFEISNMAIGKQFDGANTTSVPVPVTFNGNNSVVIDVNEYIYSDPITPDFSISVGEKIIVILDAPDVVNGQATTANNTNISTYTKSGEASYNLQNVSGYTLQPNKNFGLIGIAMKKS